MITKLNVASIYVLDKDEALDFYVNKLGLEKGNDVRQGTYRWLTVRVPGDDPLQRAGRELPGQAEDLGVAVARAQSVGIVRVAAPTAGVRHEQHDLGAARAQRLRLARHGGGERGRREAGGVGSERLPQAPLRHRADDPDAHAGGRDERGRRDVRPRHGLARRGIDDVGGEKRELGARGRCLERAAHVAGVAAEELLGQPFGERAARIHGAE